MFSTHLLRAVLLCTLALVLVLMPASPLRAAAHDVGCTGGVGDVAGLISAITAANVSGGTIDLAPGCIYTLTAIHNPANGLPVVANNITINARGSTIQRDPALGANPPLFRLFQVSPTGSLALNDVTLSGGNVTHGGGIYNSGTVTLTNSSLLGNRASSLGGAIYNWGRVTAVGTTFGKNDATEGGGIWNFAYVTGVNSTFVSNTATTRGGAFFLDSNGTFTNTTFISNTAGTGGGAIFNAGTLRLAHSTLSDNGSAANGGDNIYNNEGISKGGRAETFLKNTIIANGQSGSNCVNKGIVGEIIYDNTGNLRWPATDTSCPGTIPFGDPRFGTAGKYGGNTWVLPLMQGSTALDAVTDCTDLGSQVVSTDQRGVARPQRAKCDTGAFESGAPVFTAETPPNGKWARDYTYTFTATGYPSSITFAVAPGSSPPPGGLSLGGSGALAGKPNAVGTFGGIVVRASNRDGYIDTPPLSISINAELLLPLILRAR